MIEATCPSCGEEYFGWVLQEDRVFICDICGGDLVLAEG